MGGRGEEGGDEEEGGREVRRGEEGLKKRFLPPKNAFFATLKVAFFATSSEAPLLLDTLPRDSGAESAYSGVFSER